MIRIEVNFFSPDSMCTTAAVPAVRWRERSQQLDLIRGLCTSDYTHTTNKIHWRQIEWNASPFFSFTSIIKKFFYRFFLCVWIVQPQRVSVKHDPFFILVLRLGMQLNDRRLGKKISRAPPLTSCFIVTSHEESLVERYLCGKVARLVIFQALCTFGQLL